MKTLLFIGDVHGKKKEYRNIIDYGTYDMSFCVGDFGFQLEHLWASEMLKDNDKIVFGNHDDTRALAENYSIGNRQFFPEFDLFAIRGAMSVDKQHRILGRDYFDNEELNYIEATAALDDYSKHCPSIVVSHDGPQSAVENMFPYIKGKPTSTRMLHDSLLEVHAPNIWIFGHHHKSMKYFNGQTLFICLAELETLSLTVA